MRKQKYIRLLLALLVVLVSTANGYFWLSPETSAATTTYLVDNPGDASFTPGGCDDGQDDGDCTLREALSDAFGVATDDVLIIFDDDLDNNSSTPNVVTLTNASGDSNPDDLDKIQRTDVSVTIDGENHVTITQDGTGTYDRLFRIGDSLTNSTNNVIKNLIIDNFKNGVEIFGSNNTILGLTINAGQDAGICDNTGQRGIAIYFPVSYLPVGNSLLNNTITCFRKGILAQAPGDTTINGNILRNNKSLNLDLDIYPVATDVNSCFTGGIEIDGRALTSSGSLNTISNNHIELNGSERPTGVGAECDGDEYASGGIILSPFFATDASEFVISGNHISETVGDGILLINADESIIENNNILERNGTSTAGTADFGNGIALRCFNNPLGAADDTSTDNFVLRNNISRNADNGIFVSKTCTGEENNENAFLENSIYENGRSSGITTVADDGIGIDLQGDSDVTAFAYSNANANISPNSGSDTGGNDMQNFPVITGATYNSGTNEWTVAGTGDTNTLVEIFQVGCSDPNTITTCDTDDNDSAGLGFGSGRYFLGRTMNTAGTWSVVVPSTIGFSGGLITSTATSTTFNASICMAASTSASDLQTTLAGRRVCNTSEFSENFLAQSTTSLPSDLIEFNKFVAPSTVAQGDPVTVILTTTNVSQVLIDDSEITISDNLAAAQLSLNAGTCTWSVGSSNGVCSQSGNNFVLTGFDSVGLSPEGTLIVQFTATVSSSATLGNHTNNANILYTVPNPDLNMAASDDFTVTAPGGGNSCGVINTNPDATFTIDGNSHTGTYSAAPHLATFLGTGVSGNAPLTHQWYLDGTSQGAANPVGISLTAGSHTVTHIVIDCDGGIDTEIVSLSITGSSAPALTLSKSILPNTNLHTGDAVTVTIQVTNPVTSGVVQTNIVLDDVFTALNQSVTSCHFEKNSLPGGGSSTCIVAPDGSMTFPLTSTGLQPNEILYIQYTTTVTGAAGTYTNPVSYISSSSQVTPAPTPASAQFTVVSGTSTGTCSGTANVEAEFTINGEPTPSTLTRSAGTYTFTNDDTSGDGLITYLWAINGVNQPENSNSITRTLAPGTSTVTLMKSDCNGSVDSDTLVLTISGGTGVGTGGTFDVTKTVENPKTLYAVDGGSTDSIVYRITIKNNESTTREYTLEDDIPTTFKDGANVLDLAGGTNASLPGLVKVTNISLLPGETKTVRYSVNFKSANDFPLNLYSLDHSADPEDDGDFYADDVKEEDIETDNNDYTDENDITDAPDGQFVSLGEDGSLIVDVGAKKVIVDGDGDDFGLFMIDNHAKDFDRADEDVKVFVSQDGINYKKVSGDDTFDLEDADMPWARYIKIEDDSNTTVTQSGAAGIDIDAVCLFNLGVAVTNNVNVTMANAVGSASNTIYVDVTEAFDDALQENDCHESGTTITTDDRQARTVELPPPPQPLPTTTPSVPTYFPPVSPVLPKTGPEAIPFAVTAIAGALALLRQRRKK